MSGNMVRDWMMPEKITTSASNSLQDSYWPMLDSKFRRLLVTDNERLVGIVTMEDLRYTESAINIGLETVKITDTLPRMRVRQVMSKDPKTIAPDAPLIGVAHMMLEHRISSLPVLEGNHLVGIITESDTFRAFVKLEGKD
jgi:CBS domain-containing protein